MADIQTASSLVSQRYRGNTGSPAPAIWWVLYDINGDGRDELFLACAGDDLLNKQEKCIFDVWTSPGDAPYAAYVHAVGPGIDKPYGGMYGFILCADDSLATRWGLTNTEEYYYAVPTDGNPAYYVEGWARLRAANYQNERRFFYYAVDAGYGQSQITEDEYTAMCGRHAHGDDEANPSTIQLDWHPLAEYGL